MHKIEHALAAGFIPYGSMITVDAGRLAVVTHDVAQMSGIAKRGGRGEHGFETAERVTYQSEGEVMAVIVEPIDIFVGGILTRIPPGQHYADLRNGKIVR